MTASQARLAVDIGGTFTDIALAEGADIVTAKTPTTPGDPVAGVLDGVALALQRADLTPQQIGAVVHGTTLATNALIERKGAEVALLTTQGFRDVLEIAYERRYDQYDIFLEKPPGLVPRERCFTLPERVDARGQVLEPLQEDGLDAILAELDRMGVKSLAVGFLHSYANPAHEVRLRDLLLARRPGLSISLSSEVSPEIREYERLSTTVADAYIKPLMARYLNDLERRLTAAGFSCPLTMMTSGGGMTTLETAARFPIRLVESGPSGGAILAGEIARECGLDEVVSFDMGGTTAKVCLIDQGRPQTSRRFEVARAARFIKGSGLPVRIPVIEMIEIGAGGGSIAGVDGLGRITVGPESAGAEPGPACYGRGGARATVTDCDTALGYLDPEAFAEGRLRLDPAAALDAIAADLAEALALSPEAAAEGVCRMVDENMANAARVHAVERGKTLARRTMIAFGGNGPLHATRVAEKVGIRRIVVPPDPGVGSAIGFLRAPVAYEIVRSHYTLVSRFDDAAVGALFDAMEKDARAVVEPGAMGARLEARRSAYMRYHGQGHEIEITLPDGPIGPDMAEALRRRYEAAYAELYGRAVPEMEIEVVNWALLVTSLSAPARPLPPVETTARPSPTGFRSVVSAGEVPSFARGALAPGDVIPGPALIVEPQTTTYVSAAFEAQVDGGRNLVLTRTEATGA